MRNVFMVLAMMLWSIGCGSGYKVMVVPLNEMDTITSKAVILAVAEQPKKDVDVEPDVVACKCGGTGRSGDGLGPCACPDGCKCKTKTADAPEAADDPPADVSLDEIGDAFDGAKEATPDDEPIVPELVDDTASRLLQVEMNIEKLAGISQQLLDVDQQVVNINQLVKTEIGSLDSRVKLLEAALAKGEATPGSSVEKSEKQPERQVVAILRTDGTCKVSEEFRDKQVEKLVDSGWTAGGDDTYQIVVVEIGSDAAKKFSESHEQAVKFGTPYFAFLDQGKFVKGFRSQDGSAATVAQELNKISESKKIVSGGSAEPWKSLPETWPARVPINGTTKPSKQALISHLRGGGRGGENHVNDYFSNWPLESMTIGQLVTLHDSDHPVASVPYTQPMAIEMQRLPFVSRTSATIQYSTGQRCRNGRCR
jgi:hypothetical protein